MDDRKTADLFFTQQRIYGHLTPIKMAINFYQITYPTVLNLNKNNLKRLLLNHI